MENSSISPLSIPSLEKRMFYSTITALFLTGIIYLFLDSQNDLDSTQREIKTFSLHLHGWLSPILTFLFGCIISSHVKAAWSYKKNLPSGLSLICLISLLIITATALYYVSSDFLRLFSWWVHILAGFTLPVCIFSHVRKIIKRN